MSKMMIGTAMGFMMGVGLMMMPTGKTLRKDLEKGMEKAKDMMKDMN